MPSDRLKVTVRDDRQVARLEFQAQPTPLVVDAADLSRIIDALTSARAEMLPAVAEAPNLNDLPIQNRTLWRVAGRTLDDKAVLMVRHAGAGWFGIKLDEAEIGGIQATVRYALQAPHPVGEA